MAQGGGHGTEFDMDKSLSESDEESGVPVVQENPEVERTPMMGRLQAEISRKKAKLERERKEKQMVEAELRRVRAQRDRLRRELEESQRRSSARQQQWARRVAGGDGEEEESALHPTGAFHRQPNTESDSN